MKESIKHTACRGFTLIELAIVIVIIGLIIGGIVIGVAMIGNAEIRSVISQIDRYKVAVNSFRIKYNAIPGDIKNAELFGLGHDQNGALNICIPANGNGDQRLDDSYLVLYSLYRGELANFWIHLSNAGLIKERFVPFYPVVNFWCYVQPRTGLNYPSSAIGNGIIAVTDDSDAGRLFFILGSMPWTGTGTNTYIGVSALGHIYSLTKQPELTALQAFQIDSKIDDGSFNTGTVKAINGWESRSTSGWVTRIPTYSANSVTGCIYNSSYNIDYPEKACVISIK